MDKITDETEICTTDLSRFGALERREAERLLFLWRKHGLPSDFLDEKVTIMFNTHSGKVFLTNSEYQACMVYETYGSFGPVLAVWYSCPNCGAEGFIEEVRKISSHFDILSQSVYTGASPERLRESLSECRSWVRDLLRNLREGK